MSEHIGDELNVWRYALAKQLDTAHTLDSDYGSLALDDELRRAVGDAIRTILKARIAAGIKGVRHE